MNYRRLGTSNLRVSPLCLGTMMFGEQTPDDDAARIVASARDHGLNFIDTADVYNDGRSEERRCVVQVGPELRKAVAP